MRKIGLFVLILLSLNAVSQSNKIKQNKMKINGVHKVFYGNKYFNIDTSIITVKANTISKLALNYKIVRKNKLGFVDIKIPGNQSFDSFINSLVNDKSFDIVEYCTFGNYVEFVPNDPQRTLQWNLPTIHMYDAWELTTGNSNVLIGVVDSGTDWQHPDIGLGADIYQNIYINTGEDTWSDPNNPTTGNGVDDDNNGFIDDWKGWNFADNSNDVRTTFFHGTFVAGIVGAKTNNSVGIAGIAGGNHNSGARIVPYCIGTNSPVSSLIDDAIIAAVDNGVKVIQMSLSIPSSSAIDAAIQYAIDNNVVVVCAAGNNYSATVNYPASNPNVISVGATGQNNRRADFSNYGTRLDVVAPGVDIYSTTLNNTYETSSGTSFAAPQVSAIAALLLSNEPGLTPTQIRQIIESTSQKVGGYAYQTTSGRPNGTWNNEMGYGLIDAYAAVASVTCETVSFTNQTVTSSRSVSGCNVNVQNVTVQNGAKLSIDAEKETVLNGSFEVQLGSQLEIQ